jgi:cobalt/nickel transport system permease protein
MDPRIKSIGFFLLLLSSAFAHSLFVIAGIYLLSLILAAGSHVFSIRFFRRIWIFMPFYSTLIAFPALFFTPGTPVLELPFVTITAQGAKAAMFLILRVATSVSYMFLLVLTTPWTRFLKALRSIGLPRMSSS